MVNNLSAAPGTGRGEANIMRPKPNAFDIGEEAEGVHAGRRSRGCARPRMGGEEDRRRLNLPPGVVAAPDVEGGGHSIFERGIKPIDFNLDVTGWSLALIEHVSQSAVRHSCCPHPKPQSHT
jgi:hypothetical protein